MALINSKKIISTVLCLLYLIPLSVQAIDSAIIIFDGSGSMKKKIDGKPKIEVAREVMGSLMLDWNEDIDLGLMVFGHRTRACDDIEMVVPVGKPETSRLLNAINSLVPKGETPIGTSLKLAAEQLNYIESPSTVILISDGEESCKSDPCAVAKTLKKNAINFTAHVIGFDVSDKKKAKALEQLKCIADTTEGKFFEAKNAEGLKYALAETAKVVAETKPPSSPPETGVRLKAVPIEGAEPFSKRHDVTYYVEEDKKDLNGKRKRIGVKYDVNPLFILATGKYVVSAERGNARVEFPIEVKAGELIEHTFILNVGNLRLLALPAEGAEPFSKRHDVTYYVEEDKKDLNGKRKRIGVKYDVNPLFILATGKYVVSAERGNARVEFPIDVKAGELIEHTFILNAGNLRLSAVPATGSEPFSKRHDVTYYVDEEKKDLDGKRKRIGVKYDVNPLFKLAAGKYVVVAERGNSRIEFPIEVKSGELVEHTFILNAGNLRLSALPAEGSEPFSKRHDVTYYVEEDKKDLDGKRKRIGVKYDVNPLFKLAAGKYVVVAERGNIRIEVAIEVKAGELVDYTFIMTGGSSPDIGE